MTSTVRRVTLGVHPRKRRHPLENEEQQANEDRQAERDEMDDLDVTQQQAEDVKGGARGSKIISSDDA